MLKKLKAALYTGLISFTLLIMTTTAQAAMVSTPEVLNEMNRAELHSTLERSDVQQQLVDMGVDPNSAIQRVQNMTDEEVAALNGQIETLPAGAGISTTDLLLIIILILLL